MSSKDHIQVIQPARLTCACLHRNDASIAQTLAACESVWVESWLGLGLALVEAISDGGSTCMIRVMLHLNMSLGRLLPPTSAKVQVLPCCICEDFGGHSEIYTFSAPHRIVLDPCGDVRQHSILMSPTAQLEATTSKCGLVCGQATYMRVPASRKHACKYYLNHL